MLLHLIGNAQYALRERQPPRLIVIRTTSPNALSSSAAIPPTPRRAPSSRRAVARCWPSPSRSPRGTPRSPEWKTNETCKRRNAKNRPDAHSCIRGVFVVGLPSVACLLNCGSAGRVTPRPSAYSCIRGIFEVGPPPSSCVLPPASCLLPPELRTALCGRSVLCLYVMPPSPARPSPSAAGCLHGARSGGVTRRSRRLRSPASSRSSPLRRSPSRRAG